MDMKQKDYEEQFLRKIYDKWKRNLSKIDTLFPYTTKDGLYDNVVMPPYSWTCGFFGGMLWWLYKYEKDKIFFERAKQASERMDDGLNEFWPLGHDVGFQYLLTTIPDYIMNKSDRARKSSLHAATLLTGRFNLAGRYIRAWNEGTGIDPENSKAGYAIIDCMMNIPLLFWASQESGDPRFKQIAMAHADTVIKEFIKEDGSSCHIVVFDPQTGKAIDRPCGQGYAQGSSWTRGQGWAIYGFAMCYGYTGEERYLKTALNAAKYFIKNMGDREVPPIDFMQPAEDTCVDTSAAMIAACGMAEMQRYVSEEDSIMLEEAITKLLRGAYNNCDFGDEEQSILQNSSELYHGPNHNMPIIYADFYLIELLMKRRGNGLLYYTEKQESAEA